MKGHLVTPSLSGLSSVVRGWHGSIAADSWKVEGKIPVWRAIHGYCSMKTKTLNSKLEDFSFQSFALKKESHCCLPSVWYGLNIHLNFVRHMNWWNYYLCDQCLATRAVLLSEVSNLRNESLRQVRYTSRSPESCFKHISPNARRAFWLMSLESGICL